MAVLSLSLLLASGLLVCVAIIVKRIRSPLSAIPGPWLNKLTSVPLKYHELRANRTIYIQSLHERYGNAVRIGPSEVAFASLDAMREIYMSKGSGYDKTEFYNLFKQFGIRTMFSTLDKEKHAKRRRIIADRYANTNIVREESLHGIEERSRSFAEKCLKLPGQEMDIYLFLHAYAFDCVTHHLFHPYGSDSINQIADEEMLRETVFDSSLVGRLLMHYNPTLGKFIHQSGVFGKPRGVDKAKALVLDAVEKRDVADFTLVNRLQDEKLGLNKLDIASECMDHMLAGIETTGDALCFLMWQISQPGYETIQRALHSELESSSHIPFEQLPYLDALVKEGLRMFPSIPMSFPRYVPRGGRSIDNFWVPEGTVVSCQPFSLHRIDDTVFPDPHVFRPERWLEKEGELERNRLFFAFSNGGRGCIGRHLAIVEMKVLLRDLYSRFSTTPAEGMDADMAMDDQIFTSRPKDQRCILKFTTIDGMDKIKLR